MKILSIDTSTEACSAALLIDGEIQVKFEIAPQQHSNLILDQCNALLLNADIRISQLDAIAFGRGPGSFTGLRIAAGVTQGMAFAADLPVICVSTLAAQAQKIHTKHPKHPNQPIFSAIDARMGEIYWGVYQSSQNNVVTLISSEEVNKAADLTSMAFDKLIGVGSGWKVYEQDLIDALTPCQIMKIFPDILPSAEEIAILAADKLARNEIVSAEQAIPVYIRNNVAKKAANLNK